MPVRIVSGARKVEGQKDLHHGASCKRCVRAGPNALRSIQSAWWISRVLISSLSSLSPELINQSKQLALALCMYAREICPGETHNFILASSSCMIDQKIRLLSRYTYRLELARGGRWGGGGREREEDGRGALAICSCSCNNES